MTAARDDDLLARICRGDPTAEDEFARRFGPRLRAVMLVWAGHRDIADDLAQEALFAALRSLRAGHLKDPARLAAFVSGTARNVLKSWFRVSGHRPSEVSLPGELAAPPPGDAVEAAELGALFRAAVDHLDETDRAIVTMTFVGGLRAPQIAARLGLTSGAVRTRRSRALKRVTESLDHRLHPAPPR